MAKEHRIRVVVGHDEEGNEIIKRLSATDELKLADKVIEAVVKSGRIKDFIDQEIEYGPHEKQAQEEAAQPPVVKTKFSDYIVQWRRIFKTGKAATYEVFMDAKQSVLLKWFGDKYIEDIAPTDVQDFLSHRAKTYKKATVKADWAMLKEVLDSAVSDDLIVKNPAKDKRVHNPAKAGEGTAPLTREQIASIQKAIPELEDSRERCLIALLAYTSMRREEVLGLMWENINFETRMIEIKQAVVHPVNVAVTKETKNEFSVRPFPMCDQLYNILLGCRKQRGYVISKEDGSPVSQVTYRRLWDSLKSHIELYGMDDSHQLPNDLRDHDGGVGRGHQDHAGADGTLHAGDDAEGLREKRGKPTAGRRSENGDFPGRKCRVLTASLDVNRKIVLTGLVKCQSEGCESSLKSRQIHRKRAAFRAICTKKRVALCATLWCGKQDLNLHES